MLHTDVTRKGSAVEGVEAMWTFLLFRVVPDSTALVLVFATLHVVRPVQLPPLATSAKVAAAVLIWIRIRMTAQAPAHFVIHFVIVDSEVCGLSAVVVVHLVQRPEDSAMWTFLDRNGVVL